MDLQISHKGRIHSWAANLSGQSGEFGQGTASPGQGDTLHFSPEAIGLKWKLTTMCVIEVDLLAPDLPQLSA